MSAAFLRIHKLKPECMAAKLKEIFDQKLSSLS